MIDNLYFRQLTYFYRFYYYRLHIHILWSDNLLSKLLVIILLGVSFYNISIAIFYLTTICQAQFTPGGESPQS